MSLKNIRQNYSKLLSAFEKSGIKITESQKADLDTFIVALGSQMTLQKEKTVKATRKVVAEQLEKEYRKVVESVIKNQTKNTIWAAKIQNKIASINEAKKLACSVNDYLDLYVESVLPTQTVVDYDKMQKLENVFESLKSTLLVNDEAVERKQVELSESFSKNKKNLETKVALLQAKLNESMKKELSLVKTLKVAKGKELLESKVKDLPILEARQIKKRLDGCTPDEITSKFKRVFESVKREIDDETNSEETTLESEISKIIQDKPTDKPRPITASAKPKMPVPVPEGEDEDILAKTKDEIAEDDEDDIELSDEEKIDESLMSRWISKFNDISTHGY